jgi:thiol-disulfide isomerase/thioredoxin
MKRCILTISLLALVAQLVHADDKPPAKVSAGFESLVKEFQQAQQKFQQDASAIQQVIDEAKTDAEKKEAEKRLASLMKDAPAPKFAPRFLEFIDKNPKDTMVLNAAVAALQLSFQPAGKDATHDKAVAYLQANFAAKPEIKMALRFIAEVKDPAAEPLLREILAKNTDRRLQGKACKILADSTSKAGEADQLNKLLKDKYAEFFPDLSVGKPVPNIVSQNLDGKQVRMADLKGKVVVIDIWATWCGPCKAMIPHERDMVAKFKDKPFTLVSVSIDDTKEAVADFLKTEKMPWTHWWAGPDADWIEDWNIQSVPSIYVIDAKGIIRHTDLRGEDLEKAVGDLIKEAEKK